MNFTGNLWLALDCSDKIMTMYCHNPEGINILSVLTQHYKDENKLNRLFDLGGIYKLRPEINDNNNNDDRRYCMFLKRDYSHNQYVTDIYLKSDDYNLENYINHCPNIYSFQSMRYSLIVYSNGRWNEIDHNNCLFNPLKV